MQCDVECLQMEKKKKTWNVQINTNASEFCWSNFLPVLVPCTFIQRFAMVSNRHFSQWWQVKNYLSCLALICWTPYPNVGCNFLARIDGHFRMSTNRERKNWNSGASTDEKEWNSAICTLHLRWTHMKIFENDKMLPSTPLQDSSRSVTNIQYNVCRQNRTRFYCTWRQNAMFNFLCNWEKKNFPIIRCT